MKPRSSQLRDGDRDDGVVRRRSGVVVDMDGAPDSARANRMELQTLSMKLRNTEIALAASKDRYLSLYELSPIGYLTLGPTGVIVEVNQTCVALLIGTDHRDLLGTRFSRFIVAKDKGCYQRTMAKVRKKHRRQTCALTLLRRDGSEFQVQLDCVELLTADAAPKVCVTVTDLTERRQAEAEIVSLAFYDSLTKLPNRRLLLDRLQQATIVCARSQLHGAILFIDLDGFKLLNDTHGHNAGDQLLQQVAMRLTASVRERDTVARLGGDEFVVMLEELSGDLNQAIDQAIAIAEKILDMLSKEYRLGSEICRSTASIGATLFGKDREQVKDLLKRADLALYRAKTAGGCTVRFFEPEMETAMTARAGLLADLRRGIQEKQFVLYYQPQVDHEGRMTGAEALLRWQHPLRGLLPPTEFIALAEERGHIVLLGQWVLDAACRQLAVWGRDAWTADLAISINVSAREFSQPEFVQRTMEAVTRAGANPARLVLEFTESLMLSNVTETVLKMEALKARGVRLSLDDFGTGYSSLTYLKNLPLDQLKMDRSFVRDVLSNPIDAAIARTILSLGKSLGMAVIAEGIETEEQLAFFAEHGCRSYQGFLFGHPAPIEDLRVVWHAA